MVFNNILEAIGSTPLIRLDKIPCEDSADIFVKCETINVGGSIKIRPAYNMILSAQKKGLLNKNSIIVEPTSGNQGISLALVGAVFGYKVKVIMPDSVSVERRKLIEQYGAEVILIKDKGDIGKCISECKEMSEKMQKENENIFVPGQFENIANVETHRNYAAIEILEQIDRPIHGFCSGIGAGGTITGVGEVLKKSNPNIVILGVEPENGALLSGKKVGTHLQMGTGDGIVPEILNQSVYEDICIVKDSEAIAMSRRLAKEEGLLCGISSGSNVVAALRLAKTLGKGKTVVTILPDTGERYVSTELFSN